MQAKLSATIPMLTGSLKETIELSIDLTGVCHSPDFLSMQQGAGQWLQTAFATKGMPKSAADIDTTENQNIERLVLTILQLSFDPQKDVMLTRLREIAEGVTPSAIERFVERVLEQSPS